MARDDTFKQLEEAGTDFLESARARATEFLRDLAEAGDATQKGAQNQINEIIELGRQRSDQLVDMIRNEIRAQIAQLGLVTKAELDGLRRLIGKPTGSAVGSVDAPGPQKNVGTGRGGAPTKPSEAVLSISKSPVAPGRSPVLSKRAAPTVLTTKARPASSSLSPTALAKTLGRNPEPVSRTILAPSTAEPGFKAIARKKAPGVKKAPNSEKAQVGKLTSTKGPSVKSSPIKTAATMTGATKTASTKAAATKTAGSKASATKAPATRPSAAKTDQTKVPVHKTGAIRGTPSKATQTKVPAKPMPARAQVRPTGSNSATKSSAAKSSAPRGAGSTKSAGTKATPGKLAARKIPPGRSSAPTTGRPTPT